VADKATEPENPFTPESVTVNVELDPWLTLRVVGLVVMLKSGPLTDTFVE